MWQRAGKADFAQAAAIISRFDPGLRESLSRSEGKVLQWVIFYCWRGGERSPQAGHYCSLSQGETGEKLQRSRWTVARALARLSERGLISSLRRRPTTGGQWTTNLYFLTGKLKAILARILGQVREKTPCSKTAPQEFRKKTTKGKTTPPPSASSSCREQYRDFHKPFEEPRWVREARANEIADSQSEKPTVSTFSGSLTGLVQGLLNSKRANSGKSPTT